MIVPQPQKQFPWLQQRPGFTPAQALVLGFATLILVGAFLLSLPLATSSGQPLNFIDALFTATSAVAVTGLVVVDTGNHFSTFGQVIILCLIQMGGLGIMTMSTLFALFLGKKITLRGRILIQESLNQPDLSGLVRLIRYVVLLTLTIEGIGAFLLFLRWYPELGLRQGLFHAVFHAVSGFANAGFDLQGNFTSLTGYQSDPLVNFTMMGLIVMGGLGFAVVFEILHWRQVRRFSLHSKLVLKVTALLLLLGTGSILLLEWNNPVTLGNLDLGEKVMAALFQAVTPRTAGFNTVPLDGMRSITLLLLLVLMFIGASPGSTGGGIKTTTFAALVLGVWAFIKGQPQVIVFERSLPENLVMRSISIVGLAMALIFFTTGVLLVTEGADFLVTFFEGVSAFGTVGLSLGLTPDLSPMGRIAVIVTMFIGRVGPLTLAFALGQRKEPQTSIRYGAEKVMVG